MGVALATPFTVLRVDWRIGMAEREIELKSRCKHTLFIKKHKCVKYKGYGYLCKYCFTPMIELKRIEMKKEERRGK